MSHEDLRPDDEVVSAHLDGEATEAEARRVESEPALRARLEVFRSLSEEISAVERPVVDDELVAAAVSAAGIGAPADARAPRSGPAAGTGDAEVIPLARRRVHATTIASIAAAIVLLVLLGGALAGPWREDADHRQVAEVEADVEAGSVSDASAGGDAATDQAPGAPGGGVPAAPEEDMASAPTTAQLGIGGDDGAHLTEPVDLGSFETREEARVAVTAAVDETFAGSDDEERSASGVDAINGLESLPCVAGIMSEDDELEAPVWSATFALPEGRHEVLLFDLVPGGATNGTHRLYEVALPGCEVISKATISP